MKRKPWKFLPARSVHGGDYSFGNGFTSSEKGRSRRIDDWLFRKAFMEEIPAHSEIVRRSNELDVHMDDLPGKLSEAHGIGS